MAEILICDLCGKQLGDRPSEQYKFKKLHAGLDGVWWKRIDVHEDCRKKLFEETGKQNPPTGGSSQQDE